MSGKGDGRRNREETREAKCAGCFLACGFCKILCFTGCKTFFPCCFTKEPPPRPEYSILCVGLSGAGKSTLLGLLAGEILPQTMEQTMGFSMKTVLRREAILHIKELGGAESVRGYWSKYYSGQEALIFVVDSSSDGVEEKLALGTCLEDPSLSSVPLLIVYNKQDLPEVKNTAQWAELLDLDTLCTGRDYQMVGCSQNNLQDIQEALDRLAHQIYSPSRNFETT